MYPSKKRNEIRVVHDVVYTPENIAQKIISLFDIKPTDKVLDAFAGKNMVFFDNYPECQKDWCEIELGKDFFDYNEHVDWIITNPPYSKYTEVMKHSYEIADNIVYLIPLNKISSSWGRCVDLDNFGGIVKLWIMPANKCGFPFGFPACACHIKRNYKGDIKFELWD